MSDATPIPATRLLAFLVARLSVFGAVATMVCVSAMVLMHWGIPYGMAGGSQLLKIHPATYLAALAFLALLAALGPARILATLWRDHPGVLVFAAAIGILGFQAIVVQQKPVSPLVDTFVSALFMFVLLTRLGLRDRTKLALFLHVFFLVNSGLGYIEQITTFRLTPFIMDGVVATFEFRSTALLGHPLANAAQTGIYLILISGPAGRGLDPRLRAALILFHIGALACFGGRTAAVLIAGILAARGFISFGKVMAGGHFDRRAAMGGIALATVLTLALVVLGQLGAFDRFLGRFSDDAGSAHTRLAMLHVFDRLTTEAIILGPNPMDIAAAQRRLDITTAIESFLVAFPAYYGVLVTALFFAGLGALFFELARLVGPAAYLPIVFFFVINASANGISTKTLDLSIMLTTVAMVGGFRTDPRPSLAPRALGPRAPSPRPA